MTRGISNTEEVFFSARAAGLTVRKSMGRGHLPPWAPLGLYSTLQPRTTAKMTCLSASFTSGLCDRWRLKQVQGGWLLPSRIKEGQCPVLLSCHHASLLQKGLPTPSTPAWTGLRCLLCSI